jgi:hypothetical protein
MSGLAETPLAETPPAGTNGSHCCRVRSHPHAQPPGDTCAGTARLAAFLAARGTEHRLIAPKADSPNLVAQLTRPRPVGTWC